MCSGYVVVAKFKYSSVRVAVAAIASNSLEEYKLLLFSMRVVHTVVSSN
jgi:hypothetical protein